MNSLLIDPQQQQGVGGMLDPATRLQHEDELRRQLAMQQQAQQQQLAAQGMVAQQQPQQQMPQQAPLNPMKAWVEQLRDAGLVPPEREVYTPTAEDEARIRHREFTAGISNAAAHLTGGARQDINAIRDNFLAPRQKPLDEAYLTRVEQAKAARDATPDDLVKYLAYIGNGGTGDLNDFLVNSGAGQRESDFMTKARMMQAARARETGNPEYELTTDEMTNIMRGPPSFANMPLVIGQDGRLQTYGGNDKLSSMLAQQGEAVAGGKSWGAFDAAFEQEAGTAYSSLAGTRDTVAGLYELIEANKDMPTGALIGRISPMYSELVGYMNTLSTILTIPLLAEAKLQPVTEQEFRTMNETIASVMRDPAANIGSLKAQLRHMDSKLRSWEDKMTYYAENGSMRGYGGRAMTKNMEDRQRKLATPPIPGNQPQDRELPPLPPIYEEVQP
jgi:hypothetical protein